MGIAWVVMERTRLGCDETVHLQRPREHPLGGYTGRGRRTMGRGVHIVLKNYAEGLRFRD
jgi:hypothetical protein